jgi:hypothetical protein
MSEQEQHSEVRYDPALFPYDVRQLPSALVAFERRHGRHELRGSTGRVFVYRDGASAQYHDLAGGYELFDPDKLDTQTRLYNSRLWHEKTLKKLQGELANLQMHQRLAPIDEALKLGPAVRQLEVRVALYRSRLDRLRQAETAANTMTNAYVSVQPGQL